MGLKNYIKGQVISGTKKILCWGVVPTKDFRGGEKIVFLGKESLMLVFI
jgi:hypothetical protein